DLIMDVNQDGWIATMTHTNRIAYVLQFIFKKQENGEVQLSRSLVLPVRAAPFNMRCQGLAIGAFEPSKSGTWGNDVFNILFAGHEQIGTGGEDGTTLLIQHYNSQFFYGDEF